MTVQIPGGWNYDPSTGITSLGGVPQPGIQPPGGAPPPPGAFGSGAGAPSTAFDPTLLYWAGGLLGGGALIYLLVSAFAKPKGAR